MFYEDEEPYYEPDDEPSDDAKFWATVITFGLAVWIFAIIGFCDVMHNLADALRRYYS